LAKDICAFFHTSFIIGKKTLKKHQKNSERQQENVLLLLVNHLDRHPEAGRRLAARPVGRGWEAVSEWWREGVGQRMAELLALLWVHPNSQKKIFCFFHSLTEMNCVEVVSTLMALGLVDLVVSTDGKVRGKTVQ
jgi:hypothetical protein